MSHPLESGQHPLTNEIINEIYDGNALFDEYLRAAADWQLEQVIEWLEFGYQTDPNISDEIKRRGGFKAIAIFLEKAMRPQEDNQ